MAKKVCLLWRCLFWMIRMNVCLPELSILFSECIFACRQTDGLTGRMVWWDCRLVMEALLLLCSILAGSSRNGRTERLYLVWVGPEESHFLQCLIGSLNNFVFNFPNGRVFHTVALEVIGAGFLESVDTILPVVLQVSQASVHRVGGAHPTQTAQWEVVVED